MVLKGDIDYSLHRPNPKLRKKIGDYIRVKVRLELDIDRYGIVQDINKDSCLVEFITYAAEYFHDEVEIISKEEWEVGMIMEM